MGIPNQPGHRLPAGLVGSLSFHQDQRRGAIVDAGCVASRYGALFVKHSTQTAERLQAGVVAHMLVCVERHHLAFHLHLNGQNLIFKATFGDCMRGALLALQSEIVLIFPADLPLAGNILGRIAHVPVTERVVQRGEHHIDHLRIAHLHAKACVERGIRRPRHGFRTAGDSNICVPKHDGLRSRHNGLRARTTQAVAGQRRRFNRQSGIYHRHP